MDAAGGVRARGGVGGPAFSKSRVRRRHLLRTHHARLRCARLHVQGVDRGRHRAAAVRGRHRCGNRRLPIRLRLGRPARRDLDHSGGGGDIRLGRSAPQHRGRHRPLRDHRTPQPADSAVGGGPKAMADGHPRRRRRRRRRSDSGRWVGHRGHRGLCPGKADVQDTGALRHRDSRRHRRSQSPRTTPASEAP